jgi:hypothetical protein
VTGGPDALDVRAGKLASKLPPTIFLAQIVP